MNFWKTFWACLLALVVSGIASAIFSFILFVGMIAVISSSFTTTQKEVYIDQSTILHIDLDDRFSDNPNEDPLKNFDLFGLKFAKTQSLSRTIAKINKAAEDSNISGIFLEFSIYSTLNQDQIYQLRTALTEFKESQKFILSYADAYSQSNYYLASVADMVYVNPQGLVEWKGMGMSVMFYKNLMDKLGVEAEIFRCGKFKGAVEPFMLDHISEENRLQLNALTESMWQTALSEVSTSRNISIDSLQSYANNLAVRDAKDALRLSLVDSIIYIGQIHDKLAHLSNSIDNKPKMVNIADYHPSYQYYHNSNDIAILYAIGEIVDEGNPREEIVGYKLREEIAELADDDNVKAVVLRVDSPGGSVMASDMILNELQRLKEKKPLIVSMGNYAASGGYWISCFADRIIADPNTLTGSIGVFGLGFNVQKGASDILGINVDVIKTNTSSDMGNIFRPMTSVEKQYIQRGVDNIYEQFLTIVSEGRGINRSIVDSIAQGRVWSGTQAKELGLVDQLGTMSDAVVVAAELAQVSQYNISVYPKSDANPFEFLLGNSFNIAAKILGIGELSIEQVYKQKLEALSKKQGVLVRLPYQIELQ